METDSPIIQELMQEQIDKPRLCVNCKHIATNSAKNWETYKCMAPQNHDGVNLVTGFDVFRYEYCKDARSSGIEVTGCGTAGKWYEFYERPKPPDPLPQEIKDKEVTFERGQLSSIRAAADARLKALKEKAKAPKLSAKDLDNL